MIRSIYGLLPYNMYLRVFGFASKSKDTEQVKVSNGFMCASIREKFTAICRPNVCNHSFLYTWCFVSYMYVAGCLSCQRERVHIFWLSYLNGGHISLSKVNNQQLSVLHNLCTSYLAERTHSTHLVPLCVGNGGTWHLFARVTVAPGTFLCG